MWTGIKRIVNHKSKCKYIPTKISSNNIDVTEPKEIANTFNSYFAEIGNNLANTVPSTDTTPQQYLNNQTYDTFYLFPTSVSEIEAEISKINLKKATGPYSIPSNILRLLKTVISKPLETIFNASFATGVVPDKFKVARVLPVRRSVIDIIFHVEIFAVLLIFLSIISSSVLEVKYLDKLLVFLWVRTAHRC